MKLDTHKINNFIMGRRFKNKINKSFEIIIHTIYNFNMIKRIINMI